MENNVSLEQVLAALEKADAAGDTEGAKELASLAQSMMTTQQAEKQAVGSSQEEKGLLDFFVQGGLNKRQNKDLYESLYGTPYIEPTTPSQKVADVAGGIVADPLSFLFSGAGALSKAGQRAIEGVATTAKQAVSDAASFVPKAGLEAGSAVLPTYVGQEVGQNVAQETGSQGLGVAAGIGTSLLAGGAQSLAGSTLSGTIGGAKKLMGGQAEQRQVVQGLGDQAEGVLSRINELQGFADKVGVKVPAPLLAMMENKVGSEAAIALYRKDPEIRRVVDQFVNDASTKVQQVSKDVIGIDPVSLLKNAETLENQAKVQELTKGISDKMLSPLEQQRMKIEDGIIQLRDKFGWDVNQAAKAFEALEAKRVETVDAEKNRLYKEAYSTPVRADEATGMALRSELEGLNKDNVFKQGSPLQNFATRASKGKTDFTLEEVVTLRKLADREYRKDPMTFGQLRNIANATIDEIAKTSPDAKKSVDKLREADNYFAQNVGLPRNLSEFMKLTNSQRESTAQALVSKPQALREFLTVQGDNPEAMQLVERTVKMAIEKKAQSTNGMLDPNKLRRTMEDANIKEAMELLPQQARDDIMQWGSDVNKYAKEWAEVNTQIEAESRRVGNNALVQLSKQPASTVAGNYLVSAEYRSAMNKSLEELKRVDFSAATHARETLKANMLDKALEQKDPISYIRSPEVVEAYKGMFGKNLEGIDTVVQLQDLINKLVPKLPNLNLEAGSNDYQPRVFGQTAPSLVSTVTNPIYSPLHSTMVIASRGFADAMRSNDKSAIRDLMLNPEVAKEAIEAGKKGNVRVFFEELAKIGIRNTALATARSVYQADKQEIQQ